ncbi:11372_t:CDS:10 [Entrophospora sp. SA101]|nr:11372_t:CDS:10 [Entrophospora sp. SA101]
MSDKAGKYNIDDLSSEEFSNSFPVNTTPASKHALDGSNSGEQEETVIQENILHSIAKTTNTFRNVEFLAYYKKLKKIWRTCETELKLLHDRLSSESEDKYLSKKSLQYLSLFDQNSEAYSDSEEVKDEIISEMKKEVCNLDGLIAKFQYLSHALPISLKQYNELLYPEIYIIKSIASHLSTITKMERITDNTMERSWTAINGCNKSVEEITEMSKPMLILIVRGPSEKSSYQPIWTFVGAGIKPFSDSVKPTEAVIPKKAAWIQKKAQKVDPDNNCVYLEDGQQLKYDFLVVAPGIKINWDKIKGLPETIGKNGVTSNYLDTTVENTWELLKKFRGGNAIFTMPTTPIKCPGAAIKIAYLAEDHFTKKHIREKTNVIYNTGMGKIFSIEKYANSLNRVAKERNIKVNTSTNLIEVRGDKKEAVFKNVGTGEENTIQYDLLHVVPPMGPPSFIAESKLGNAGGWVDVDQYTLQHVKYPNIFSLGDASSAPTSKTAAAIAAQSAVVKKNLLDLIAGKFNTGEASRYDGYASCPLLVGRDKLILAEFSGYTATPMETFPFDQGKERFSTYWVTKEILPEIYWKGLLKGTWTDFSDNEILLDNDPPKSALDIFPVEIWSQIIFYACEIPTLTSLMLACAPLRKLSREPLARKMVETSPLDKLYSLTKKNHQDLNDLYEIVFKMHKYIDKVVIDENVMPQKWTDDVFEWDGYDENLDEWVNQERFRKEVGRKGKARTKAHIEWEIRVENDTKCIKKELAKCWAISGKMFPFSKKINKNGNNDAWKFSHEVRNQSKPHRPNIGKGEEEFNHKILTSHVKPSHFNSGRDFEGLTNDLIITAMIKALKKFYHSEEKVLKFPKELNGYQRKQLHRQADLLDLKSMSFGEGDGRFLVVMRYDVEIFH